MTSIAGCAICTADRILAIEPEIIAAPVQFLNGFMLLPPCLRPSRAIQLFGCYPSHAPSGRTLRAAHNRLDRGAGAEIVADRALLARAELGGANVAKVVAQRVGRVGRA